MTTCPVNNTEMTSSMKKRLSNWKLPNTKSRCTFSLEKSIEDSPHKHRQLKNEPKKPLNNILETVGDTPLVKLNNIPKEENLDCEILVKCEFFNPGGSVKDRIALRMIEDAEDAGILKPGDTLIEPTSGNTGIGLAMAAAVKGYRCIIVMPEKMSSEKVDVLRALGAEVVRTPTSARFDSNESHVVVARRLLGEIPNSHVLDQYTNAGNPLAHYDFTAEEIMRACNYHIDALVLPAGTGGTLTGVARKVKKQMPECTIVAVDPIGSVLADADYADSVESPFYEVEGIGYDFIPTVLDGRCVDKWYKCNDTDSFIMARRLIKEEGLLCGGSSGAAVDCSLQLVRELKLGAGKRVVTILPDSIRNYLTKFVNDDWMIARGFLPVPAGPPHVSRWMNMRVHDVPLKPPIIGSTTLSIRKCLEIMRKESVEQLPLVDENDVIQGVVTTSSLMSALIRHHATTSAPAINTSHKNYKEVTADESLGKLSSLLNVEQYVLVVQKHRQSDESSEKTSKICGIITRMDLVHFVVTQD